MHEPSMKRNTPTYSSSQLEWEARAMWYANVWLGFADLNQKKQTRLVLERDHSNSPVSLNAVTELRYWLIQSKGLI